eukprot:TRINITY_DN33745_c0_g1_i1.p1 TRINITY_DN33745_c0_g1~~TRINITY_DN33745_c0_g1_i1.p1  ORF type:complete len:463 (+),score=88.26 TRINITY_DN33745_c0_g1_i1:90-1391(+)
MESEINTVKNELLPIVMSQLGTISIPDVHKSSGPFKIEVYSIRAKVDPISTNHVSIQLIEGTNKVHLHIWDLTCSGSAKAKAKAWFISKTSDVSMKLHSVGIHADIVTSQRNGRPHVEIQGFGLEASEGNVDIHFHGDFIDDILNVVVSLLKGVFFGSIKSMINSSVPPAINSAVTNLLNSLPEKVKVGDNLGIRYSLASNPVTRNKRMCWALAGYMFNWNHEVKPTKTPGNIPDYDGSNNKGVQLLLSDYVLDTGLVALYKAGLIQIDKSFNVLGMTVQLTCHGNTEPSITFHNSIYGEAGVQCHVKTVQGGATTGDFSFTSITEFDLTQSIKAQTIYFQISKLDMKDVKVNGNAPDWFKNDVNELLKDVQAGVNQELGAKGIALPNVAGVNYSDVLDKVGQGYIEVAVTPTFHFQSRQTNNLMSTNKFTKT